MTTLVLTVSTLNSQQFGIFFKIFCISDNANPGKVSNNHVIVMDEVDGMAGNEDRGGMMVNTF